MRVFILTLVLILTSLTTFAGEMYVVKRRMFADVVVYVTKTPSEADIFVREVTTRSCARSQDYMWYMVKSYLPESSIGVYFTTRKSEADVVVFYSQYSLGWKRCSPFEGKLRK